LGFIFILQQIESIQRHHTKQA